jgi:hypothetical protein
MFAPSCSGVRFVEALRADGMSLFWTSLSDFGLDNGKRLKQPIKFEKSIFESSNYLCR